MITESQEKYIDPGPLKRLKKVLVEWQSMQDTSWWEEKNDAPWWYNERASLSLFAGAVWKCKGWVFEEFITKKYMTTRRGKPKNRHGRGDIMFGIGKGQFIGEAKQCWPVLGPSLQNAIEEVNACLKTALAETSQLPSYEGDRVAIVFVTPRIRASKQGELAIRVRKFVDGLKTKDVAIACLFPKRRTMGSGLNGLLPK
jgi:hypothetical protein